MLRSIAVREARLLSREYGLIRTGSVPGKAASYGDTLVFGVWPSSEVRDSVGMLYEYGHLLWDGWANLRKASVASLSAHALQCLLLPPTQAIVYLLCRQVSCAAAGFEEDCGMCDMNGAA